MGLDFNYFLNRQGVQGKRGERGEQGFSPLISVKTQTANEYVLTVQNEDGSFDTPNLRGNAIANNGGTYIRYNPLTEEMYTGNADYATNEQAGVVLLASYEQLIAGGSENLIPTSEDVYNFVTQQIVSGFVTQQEFNTYTAATAITLNNLATQKISFTDLVSSLVEGDNITLEVDNENNTITINAAGGDLSDYVTLSTEQSITGVKRIVEPRLIDPVFHAGISSSGAYGGITDFENQGSQLTNMEIWASNLMRLRDNTTSILLSEIAKLSDIPSPPDLSNYMTLDTVQTITARKLFSTIYNTNNRNLVSYDSNNTANRIGNTTDILDLSGYNIRPTYTAYNQQPVSLALLTDIPSNTITLTSLSIDSSSTNYLDYDNTTGEFGAKVDTTVTQNSNKLITSGAVYDAIQSSVGNNLLDFKWSDHLLNDASLLRADTFSWQSGYVYTSVYEHLVNDIDGITAETETIGSYTVTFYRATDGHKICLADQETTILNIYNSYGIAWYYILDTTNTQFKLPRTKYGFEGLRNNVGDYVLESLPNIKAEGSFNRTTNGLLYDDPILTGAFKKGSTRSSASGGGYNSTSYDLAFDASLSSSTYQDNAPVQERATQMYLYFYVGDYTQSAIEQTAGLNSELFNGKADVDLSNINASQSAKDTIIGWGLPDYANGITCSASLGVEQTYTAPSNGIITYSLSAYAQSEAYLKINGQQVQWARGNNNPDFNSITGSILVSKNDIIKYFSAYNLSVYNTQNIIFYPMKGAN